jgi:hypothetical protein
MVEERVGKRHPRGPSSDHEIIGFEFVAHDFSLLSVWCFTPIYAGSGARSKPCGSNDLMRESIA